MKKEILFVLPHFLGRGVEKSLLSLMKNIPRDDYEITVMFVQKKGEFLDLLPNDITICEAPVPERLKYEINQDIGTTVKVKQDIKRGRVFSAGGRIVRKWLLKDPLGGYPVDFKKLDMVKNEYDIAVCYHVHCFYLIRYVSEKIKAKHKFAWVHNDFIEVGFDIADFTEEMSSYESIFCVSNQVAEEVKSKLPMYQEKVKVFYNIVSQSEIVKGSDLYVPQEYTYQSETIKLLSVGSLERQKGFDAAIEVCSLLIKDGFAIEWCVLGDGSQKEALKKQLEALNLKNNFKLCGLKTNPYPYYKYCDIYVQPSRYEGYGIALAEAKALNCVIISTDFSGAREQIENGVNGEIVPFDIERLYEAIKTLIKDKGKRDKYQFNLAQESSIKDDSLQMKQLLVV